MCLDHGREPCVVPRCQVLALCATEVPAPDALGSLRSFTRRWGYDLGTRLTEKGVTTHHPHLIAEQVRARLVSWMRWRGERRAGACARSQSTTGYILGVRPGIDSHWEDHGPGFWHPLNDCRPYRDRLRALASACPVCHRWGVHQRSASPRTPTAPCDHDGIDWATVLVFLDWLADRGWTLQEVHEWRPQRKEDP